MRIGVFVSYCYPCTLVCHHDLCILATCIFMCIVTDISHYVQRSCHRCKYSDDKNVSKSNQRLQKWQSLRKVRLEHMSTVPTWNVICVYYMCILNVYIYTYCILYEYIMISVCIFLRTKSKMSEYVYYEIMYDHLTFILFFEATK